MSHILTAIINHPNYIEYYNKIQTFEVDREFCGHNMTHFLDVARIGYIQILEDQSSISKEDIYIVALLHDIGRHEQYANGEPHERASARLCVDILKDVGIDSSTIEKYQTAIISHRNERIKDQEDLAGYLYRADKASRSCHSCIAEKFCDWSNLKKNMQLTI